MKQYTVGLTPEAEEQLAELYGYIADRTTDATALRSLALVTVIGIFHGGRNIVAALQAPGKS